MAPTPTPKPKPRAVAKKAIGSNRKFYFPKDDKVRIQPSAAEVDRVLRKKVAAPKKAVAKKAVAVKKLSPTAKILGYISEDMKKANPPVIAKKAVAKKAVAKRYDPSQPPKKEVIRKNGDVRTLIGYGGEQRKTVTINSAVESKPSSKIEKKITRKLKPVPRRRGGGNIGVGRMGGDFLDQTK